MKDLYEKHFYCYFPNNAISLNNVTTTSLVWIVKKQFIGLKIAIP